MGLIDILETHVDFANGIPRNLATFPLCTPVKTPLSKRILGPPPAEMLAAATRVMAAWAIILESWKYIVRTRERENEGIIALFTGWVSLGDELEEY